MAGSAAPVDADLIVIGAGVVGLATAMHAARQGLSVLVLERNAGFGQETSARNSEVIHAGIYYPQGSLKAQTCVEGSARLYAFAQEHGVPVKRCGKLIVATQPDEVAQLEQIERKATAAGARDLQFIDGAQLRAMEPHLNAVAAILSPHTGIVDSHALMLAMLGVAENAGTQLVTHAAVEALHFEDGAWSVRTCDATVRARGIVNAAGLWAHDIAAKTVGLPPEAVPPLYYARGCYFGYAGAVPFRHLIYPVPVAGGLGTHLTLDLAGRARFGPDVTWVDAPDYSVPEEAREDFATSGGALLVRGGGEPPDARLCRCAPQTVGAGRTAARLPAFLFRFPRHAGAGQPVRYRVARPHRIIAAGRTGGGGNRLAGVMRQRYEKLRFPARVKAARADRVTRLSHTEPRRVAT